MYTDGSEVMLKDLCRRTANTLYKDGEETLYCNLSYAPINSGWLKHKGNLVKKVGNTYTYV